MPRAQALGLLDALGQRLRSLDRDDLLSRFRTLRAHCASGHDAASCLEDARRLLAALQSDHPPSPGIVIENVIARTGTVPLAQRQVENRISFDDLDREIEAAFEAGTQQPFVPLLQADAPAGEVFAAFESINLRWLASDEIESLDRNLAVVTEPSGLLQLEPTVQLPKLSLPEAPPTRFEDSGLFELFVDDSAMRSHDDDEDDDELLIDIDVDTTAPASSGPEQAYQRFLSRIQRICFRLFDSIEVALVGNQYIELMDVNRQFNRLLRQLDFVGLDKQNTLIAYLQHMLPITYAARKSFVDLPRQEIHRGNLAGFLLRLDELLDCLVYFVSYLIHELPGFDRERCQRYFLNIYSALELNPSEPPDEAPLGPFGQDAGFLLNARSRLLVARALNAHLDEIVKAIESATLHGMSSGYRDAVHACLEILKLLDDHDLSAFNEPITTLGTIFSNARKLDRPDNQFVSLIESFCQSVAPQLNGFTGNEQIERANALFARLSFSERVQTGKMRRAPTSDAESSFSDQWAAFRIEAENDLDDLLFEAREDQVLRRETLRPLRALASRHGIVLLERLLNTLDQHWNRAPQACSSVLVDLAGSIRALPIKDAQYAQLEALARSVIDDLMRKRSADAKPKAASEELSSVVLKLVARLDALVKELTSCVQARDRTALAHARTSCLDLAEQARRSKLHAIALALSVLSELALLAGSQRPSTEELFNMLADAVERLEACLNATIELAEDLERKLPPPGIDLYFEHWVAPDRVGRRNNLAFSRALNELAGPQLRTMNEVWAELRPHTLPNASQALAYQTALDALHQLSRYWGERGLYEKVSLHRNAFAEAMSDANSLSNVRRAFIAMADDVRNLLPSVDDLPLHRAGQHFAALCKRWNNRLFESLDDNADSLSVWTALGRQALDELSPLARESGAICFLAVTCELSEILTAAATEEKPERAAYRLRLLLYWAQRLLYALAPSWVGEAEALPMSTPLEAHPRVELQALIELQRQFDDLRQQLHSMQQLVDDGPLRFAGRSGQDALSALDTRLAQLESMLDGVASVSLETRLSRLCQRTVARAEALRKTTSVDFQLDEGTLPKPLASFVRKNRLQLECLMLALEVLAEGLIDEVFSPVQSRAHVEFTLALDAERVSGAVWHNAQGLDLPTLRRALIADGFTPAFDDDLLESLLNHPGATHATRGGAAICLAMALLARVNGKLDMHSEEGATIFQAHVPLPLR
jgi:hypothetical protein